MRRPSSQHLLLDALTDAAIAAASGPRVFERGRTYASSGAVRVLEGAREGAAQIHAEIDGTQTYTTRLQMEDGELAGSCDCPHAAEGWFCKHQVALCLVWRDRLTGTQPVVDEAARRKVQAAARRAQTLKERRSALHEFLRAQPAGALAEHLIELADHFPDIERGLRLWHKAAGSATDPRDLRALVTEALTVRGGFLPWGEVHAWTLQAATILPLLRQARERDPDSAADLALHALRRCWTAMQRADDSNGEIGELCRGIAAEWVAGLRARGPQPASFGDTWLRVQLEDPFGCVDEAEVERLIGVAALVRYRALLAAEWQKASELPAARTAGKRRGQGWLGDDAWFRLRTLERLHLAQLEKAGDIDAALAVLRADLSEPQRCCEVSAFLERHGRLREAFVSAEQGYRLFPDDCRIQEDLLRCYERDGWLEEAYALRRRQFDAHPSVEHYHHTLDSGAAAGRDRAALRAELFRAMAGDRQAATLRDVSLRAQVLCSERRWDEALQLVQPPAVCHPGVLRDLALHLAPEKRDESVALLQRLLVHGMRTAQTPYRDELDLVKEIAARLDAKSRAAWLAKLRVEFKAKRNFVRALPG